LAQKIIFDNQRAIGVEYRQEGSVKKAFAAAEVIVSGGAINSPQLLMLSGIGEHSLLLRFFVLIFIDFAQVLASFDLSSIIFTRRAACRRRKRLNTCQFVCTRFIAGRKCCCCIVSLKVY